MRVVDVAPARGRSRSGVTSAAAGRAAAEAVLAAARDALAGRVDALVTAPLNKESLAAAGHPWPGHTEMLAEAAGSARRRDAVRGRRAARRAGDHPPLAALGARRDHARTRSSAWRAWSTASCRARARPRAASRCAASTPTRARAGCSAARRSTCIAPAVARLRAEGHRRPRAASRGQPVRARVARRVRRRDRAVPRPGADPGEAGGLRPRRERDPRPALRAHVRGPRHRLRHRRARAPPTGAACSRPWTSRPRWSRAAAGALTVSGRGRSRRVLTACGSRARCPCA